MKDANFQIIYLNGPSSSGKTTLAKALQHAFEEPFLPIGVDKIIGWMPEKIVTIHHPPSPCQEKEGSGTHAGTGAGTKEIL